MRIKSYFWLVPFLSFLVGYALSDYFMQEACFEMPPLVGSTVDQIMPLLTRHNLNMRLQEYKEDVCVPAGTIVSQLPEAGQMIRPYQSVFVTLAQAPVLRTAPDLHGQMGPMIAQQLSEQQIAVQLYHIPAPYPHDYCMAQIPAPGTPLSQHRMICYVADTRKQAILWPNFIHKRVADVQEFLQVQGMPVEIIHTYSQKSGHSCVECVVVDQRPVPGAIVVLNQEKNPLRVQLQVE